MNGKSPVFVVISIGSYHYPVLLKVINMWQLWLSSIVISACFCVYGCAFSLYFYFVYNVINVMIRIVPPTSKSSIQNVAIRETR